MKCRRCGEVERVIKSGWIRGKQRWHCKACQFHFVEQDERCKPESLHQKVVRLYCSGVSYNRSGKLKGISHTTARRWVSQYAASLPARPKLESTVVELDEQCSFVGKKENKCWIWKAVDFVTGRLLDWETGSRTKATFRKLFQRLETGLHPALYCSDDWSAYSSVIPPERLAIGKVGTYRVEGHNSNTRHWFARFRRKSKVVSKTIAAIDQTLKLQAFEYLPCPPYSPI